MTRYKQYVLLRDRLFTDTGALRSRLDGALPGVGWAVGSSCLAKVQQEDRRSAELCFAPAPARLRHACARSSAPRPGWPSLLPLPRRAADLPTQSINRVPEVAGAQPSGSSAGASGAKRFQAVMEYKARKSGGNAAAPQATAGELAAAGGSNGAGASGNTGLEQAASGEEGGMACVVLGLAAASPRQCGRQPMALAAPFCQEAAGPCPLSAAARKRRGGALG